jgi:hypothetical protein
MTTKPTTQQPDAGLAMPTTPPASAAALPVQCDAFGRLVWLQDGQAHVVIPVRSFPITAPDEGLSLVDSDGHELAWIDDLQAIDPSARTLIQQELAGREFTPEIRRILSVSSYATPSLWRVETDRGTTTFTLKGEEDIRRLSGSTLLIADQGGVHFLLRNVHALDAGSRRLLDHFL